MKKQLFALAGLGALALGLVAPGAAQAANDEIVITAPYVVHRSTPERNGPIPVETISLSHTIATGDLDLRRQPDINELYRRIDYTARATCAELEQARPSELYPPAPSDKGCYREALKSATHQADAIVAAANYRY
jgi:UrcA family protein